MSAFWRSVYFLRAVVWMVLQIVLGVVATVFELVTLPVLYFLDPTHRVYQYTVCAIAEMGLYPFITVEVKVGAPPAAAAGCCCAGRYSLPPLTQASPHPPIVLHALPAGYCLPLLRLLPLLSGLGELAH